MEQALLWMSSMAKRLAGAEGTEYSLLTLIKDPGDIVLGDFVAPLRHHPVTQECLYLVSPQPCPFCFPPWLRRLPVPSLGNKLVVYRCHRTEIAFLPRHERRVGG